MKIICPSFVLNTWHGPMTPEDGIAMLRFIEAKARVSHGAEGAQTEDSYIRFLNSVVIQRGDLSVIEHCGVTADIVTDRGVTHELVRHRMFSFTQSSTRFINYSRRELEFVKPWSLHAENEQAWRDAVACSAATYERMIHAGERPQEARSILPNASVAHISVTGNLRNWRHFFLMRTSRETHPDFRAVTIPMLAEFQRVIPILFADIVPECRQIDNMRLPR